MTDDEAVNVLVRINSAMGALNAAHDAAVMLDADPALITDIAQAFRDVRAIRAKLPIIRQQSRHDDRPRILPAAPSGAERQRSLRDE